MSDHEFENIIQYQFQDNNLLQTALTHSSFVNEGKPGHTFNNERLEFLGDAIFDAIISEYLFNRLESVEEGDLTKLRALVVCERSLAECANRVSLSRFIKLGKGEENTGGRTRGSILADAMEAVIGAMYLDGGWNSVKDFVLRVFEPTIEDALSGKLHMDYKTEIQEKLQALGEADIRYVIEKEEGPDHDKTFYSNLIFNAQIIGSGSGRSKKEAEQNAAKQALERGGKFVF
ncbi:ribonuclease III [Sinanaerobacter chloroacetimidivorans]|uniref:Ribonuclease 3 n=1 Tax=Sinanaerobacter chloroacetimidivorans TaxID=2818044 RepID=A0A8J7W4C6_9FIRM|nr:ribonuclease III [Sinanaerobacter chloroacetimidivorans]MBR0598846.1 ribonuclease III [Sinanaerobacter chloroacetimidivorans]